MYLTSFSTPFLRKLFFSLFYCPSHTTSFRSASLIVSHDEIPLMNPHWIHTENTIVITFRWASQTKFVLSEVKKWRVNVWIRVYLLCVCVSVLSLSLSINSIPLSDKINQTKLSQSLFLCFGFFSFAFAFSFSMLLCAVYKIYETFSSPQFNPFGIIENCSITNDKTRQKLSCTYSMLLTAQN